MLFRSDKAKFRASLAWFPSVTSDRAMPAPGKEDGANNSNKRATPDPPPTTPMLVYAWGPRLHLLLVSELKTHEQFTSERTGKVKTVEVGRLVFEEKVQWHARDNVFAVQWLNAKVGSFLLFVEFFLSFFFHIVLSGVHVCACFFLYSKFSP